MSMLRALGFVAVSGLSLAQSVQVAAAGTVTVSYQPSTGPVVTNNQPVTGATSLQLAGVGSAVLTTGNANLLTVTAISPPWNCYGCWSQAAGDVLLSITSTAPVAGILRLQATPACLMGPPPLVDVHDDGSYELVASLPNTILELPVVLASEELRVRISAHTVNFGGATCVSPTLVEFVPQPTNLTTVGNPCGPTLGGVLWGSGNRTLTLRFGGMAGTIGAVFVGTVPTPQPGCGLATQPVVSLLLAPDPQGATFAVPVSSALVGVYTLQYVELLPNPQIVWSNGIAAVLP
jgi:hypothetical protein